jgi:hypothetical protein
MQAIVIVLTLLVIGLGVGLLLVNNAKKTAQTRAGTAESSAQEARQAASQTQSEANSYKQWMGFGESDSFDSLKKLFEEDMQKFGGTFDPDQRFYRKILEYVWDENRKIASNEASAKNEVRQLKERLLAVESEKEAQVKQFQQMADKAKQDLASEGNKFKEDYQRINAAKDKIASQLDEQRNKMDELAGKHDEEMKKLRTQLGQLDHSNEILRSRQLDPDPIAQPADGRITWVSQRYGTVWIDLGEADQLRPQITFSVFGADGSDLLKAAKKGSIEVTRILGAHMAEGRITRDDPTKPLMPGDRIYSQVWDRGRKVGFAITGFIDFDGDGKSELDQLKTIIKINNGRVDAVLEDDGKVAGDMTVHTRYLILGARPSDPRRVEKFRNAWDNMSKQADELGVETITLDEFLNLMGWQPDGTVVRLGTSARPEDFKARPIDNTRLPRTSTTRNVFRKRTPVSGN